MKPKRIKSPWSTNILEKQQLVVRLDARHEKAIKKYWKKEYGLRGRSKWVADAITSFLGNISYVLGDFDNPECERAATFADLVSISSRPKKAGAALQLSLPANVVEQVEMATKRVSAFLPGEKGIRSAIIRAAVKWHYEDKESKGRKTRLNNDFIRMAAKRGEGIR